jgi:signal transduction histidine kinase
MTFYEEILRFLRWLKEYAVGIAWTLAFGVLLFNAGMAYVNFIDVERTNDHVVQQYEILLGLEGVLAALQDAETGQRGFLIILDEKYLDQYRTGLARLNTRLAQLGGLLAGNQAQLERLAELNQRVKLKFGEMEEILAMYKKEGIEGARAVARTGDGVRYMDAIRDVVVDMENQERALLHEKTAQANQSETRALFLLITGSLVVLGVSIAVLFLGSRQLAFQRSMEQALRQANEELEQRVQHRTEALRATNESLREENIERKRLQEQADRFAAELQRSNQELELFASVASHDLQEPLRKILAFGERLRVRQADRLDETGKDYLQRMEHAAQRMRQLIDDLLAYARISTDSRPFVPVDLNCITQEVLTDLEEQIQQTQAKVEVEPLPQIEGDPAQMRQLLQNLIGNALKFHRPNEPPLVRVSSGAVDASKNGKPDKTELIISDNGIGFENRYAERIFHLFQRLHGQSEYGGTGMGLAICRKIVDRHGGSIAAQGNPGGGAVFTVTLPLTQPSGEVTGL